MKWRWVGALAFVAAMALFTWMFFVDIFAHKDIGCEMLDKPLVAAHVLKVREKNTSLHEYMQNDPVWANMKHEDPEWSYAYIGKRFQFDVFAHQNPLVNLLYVPFIKLFGVSTTAVTLYSTLFSAATVLLMAWLAWKVFDVWHAIASILCVTSSLIWLIHVKMAYGAWMPSVFLISTMVCCLRVHCTTGRRWALGAAAMCLGLLYLIGWLAHVAGFFLLALVMLIMRQRPLRTLFADGLFVSVITLITILIVSGGYAWWAHCGFWDVHSTMFDDMFNRFSQGGTPAIEGFTFPEKLGFASRCLFVDSTTPDHVDKCLEGHPAIPPLFSVFVAIGALYAIKNRSASDKLIMLWLVAVFGLLGAVMTYTHRYTLLSFPAMAILASRGIVGLGNDLRRLNVRAAHGYALAVSAAFCITICATHHSYFEDYLRHKPAVFEVDRERGMGVLSQWIKDHYSPDDTLVVYGDPIMFGRTFGMFYFFDRPYRFMYWSNYFNSFSTIEQVKAWEQTQLLRFKRLVFVFSTVLLGDPQAQIFKNDCRPFLAAHENIQPVFAHEYDGRPLFLVYEISGDSRR